MHDLYCTSLQSLDLGLSFVADSMGPSLFTSVQRAPEKLYEVRWCVTVIHRNWHQSKADMWFPIYHIGLSL